MSKDTQIQKQIEEAFKRFDKAWIEGNKDCYSCNEKGGSCGDYDCYKDIAKQSLKKELTTIATNSAENERRQIMREAGVVFVNWDKSKEEQQ
jgi:hypothetical protein